MKRRLRSPVKRVLFSRSWYDARRSIDSRPLLFARFVIEVSAAIAFFLASISARNPAEHFRMKRKIHDFVHFFFSAVKHPEQGNESRVLAYQAKAMKHSMAEDEWVKGYFRHISETFHDSKLFLIGISQIALAAQSPFVWLAMIALVPLILIYFVINVA